MGKLKQEKENKDQVSLGNKPKQKNKISIQYWIW